MMEDRQFMIPTLEVHTASPFKDLFPIRETDYQKICEGMRTSGYNMAHPVVIWGGHNGIILDGHTRLKAALEVGIAQIPVITKEFNDERTAMEYAISEQTHRRNLTDAEMLFCLNELDKRLAVGRPGKTTSNEVISGRSSQKTANLLRTSATKIEKLRAINSHAPREIIDAVSNGKMSVNRAYNETMKARKAEAGEPSQEELTKTKAEREEALFKSVCVIVRNRIEKEAQDYPEINFSEDEREKIAERIVAEIRNIVSEGLRLETKQFTCKQEGN